MFDIQSIRLEGVIIDLEFFKPMSERFALEIVRSDMITQIAQVCVF